MSHAPGTTATDTWARCDILHLAAAFAQDLCNLVHFPASGYHLRLTRHGSRHLGWRAWSLALALLMILPLAVSGRANGVLGAGPRAPYVS
jgi:hypothetical protein